MNCVNEMPSEGSQIGQQLRDWRKRVGLTQVQAGAAIGVDSVTVSRWERGAIKDIKTENVRGIARAYLVPAIDVIQLLGVDSDELGVDVSRGTVSESTAPYGNPSMAAPLLKLVTTFEREAARMGATDPELDHIHWSLHNPESSRLFYLGDSGAPMSPKEQEEELGYQIDGLRVWLERRIAKRTAADKKKK